ncbi:MAG: CbtB-domain containing protein [Nitrospinota bacterium]|nr:CbtB-domain containing protein [Nitrospinota bacterium]
MRKILSLNNVDAINAISYTAALLSLVFAVTVITFGADSAVAGAHESFHDFRHAIGMACH